MLVRADLTPGQQIAQATHVGIEHALKHPQHVGTTPNLVVLSVPDEEALLAWADRVAGWASHPIEVENYTIFYEPDYEAHTALAVILTGERFSALPLAGRLPIAA